MTFLRLASFAATVIALLLPVSSDPASAANECRIQYGWNTGNAFNGTFQNHSTSTYLDAGETKSINKSRMNFVKNLNNPDVEFHLGNAQNVTLGKNQQNPIASTYVGNVTLTKAKCLAPTGGGSSGGSSSGNTSSGGLTVKTPGKAGNQDCVGGFPDVSKTPSPAGPIPVPYPNINCK